MLPSPPRRQPSTASLALILDPGGRDGRVEAVPDAFMRLTVSASSSSSGRHRAREDNDRPPTPADGRDDVRAASSSPRATAPQTSSSTHATAGSPEATRQIEAARGGFAWSPAWPEGWRTKPQPQKWMSNVESARAVGLPVVAVGLDEVDEGGAHAMPAAAGRASAAVSCPCRRRQQEMRVAGVCMERDFSPQAREVAGSRRAGRRAERTAGRGRRRRSAAGCCASDPLDERGVRTGDALSPARGRGRIRG